MLDQLSRGRVEFGTGIGVHEHEFIRWGVDYYQRARDQRGSARDRQAWPGPRTRSPSRASTSTSTRRCRSPSPTSSRIRRSGRPCTATRRSSSRRATTITSRKNLDTDDVVARKFDLYRKIWTRMRPRRTDAAHLPDARRSMSPRPTTRRTKRRASIWRRARRRGPRRRRPDRTRRASAGAAHARGMGRDSERPDDKARGETMRLARAELRVQHRARAGARRQPGHGHPQARRRAKRGSATTSSAPTTRSARCHRS